MQRIEYPNIMSDRLQEIIPPFGEVFETEVREKSSRVERRTSPEYVPGFENYAIYSPLLEETPVHMRASWGVNSRNMSLVHLGEGETIDGNRENMQGFFNSQGFDSRNLVHVIGNFQTTDYQIEEVALDPSDPQFEDQVDLKANFVFTRDPRISLIIKQADCPVVVGYAVDKNGNDIAFIDHSGADAKNAGLTRQGLLYLRDELGVDLSKVKVSVLPGVSKENYYITNEPERRGNGISEESWKEFIDSKYPDYIVEGLLRSDPNFDSMTDQQKEVKREEIRNSQKRHVDIPEATIAELIGAGISSENIQAFIIDSYEAAERGETFSHRRFQETGKRKGRMMTAVQLKRKDNVLDSSPDVEE